MSTKYLPKFSSVAGKAPATSDLVQRELAVNTADGLLYMLNAAGSVVCLNPPHEPVYSAGTLYRSTATARVVGSGTTDANGRVTVNLTKDNTSTGIAIFSKILSKVATATMVSGGSANQAPNVVVESVTTKQVVFRCVVGVNLLALGMTMAFAGSGYTVDYDVQGLT